MKPPRDQNIKIAHYSGIFFGYSLNARVFFVAITMYFGTLIFKHTDKTAFEIFTAINILLMASAASGMSAANVPSVARAVQSANKVFDVIDEQSTLDPRDGIKKKVQGIEKGDIRFTKVDFKYPSRDERILKELDLHIPAQQKIALVGGSGCGKSTITNLLLRFYNKSGG